MKTKVCTNVTSVKYNFKIYKVLNDSKILKPNRARMANKYLSIYQLGIAFRGRAVNSHLAYNSKNKKGDF